MLLRRRRRWLEVQLDALHGLLTELTIRVRRIERKLDELVTDPSTVRQLAKELERTTNALADAVDDANPMKEE
ncbi:MAG TPA: hypothetical protein VK607_10470 [Kofleriaceae bacterium]|nr:hypothetical protein [Kofleriaceae bacterium]